MRYFTNWRFHKVALYIHYKSKDINELTETEKENIYQVFIDWAAAFSKLKFWSCSIPDYVHFIVLFYLLILKTCHTISLWERLKFSLPQLSNQGSESANFAHSVIAAALGVNSGLSSTNNGNQFLVIMYHLKLHFFRSERFFDMI